MENKIIIDHLEVYPTIVHRPMDWYEAESIIERLGPGWRLPTVTEFRDVLYPSIHKFPEFIEDRTYYWSSANTNNAGQIFSFHSGRSILVGNRVHFSVLPVRDFTDKDAVEYLLKEF
jgi:hypothetical protein